MNIYTATILTTILIQLILVHLSLQPNRRNSSLTSILQGSNLDRSVTVKLLT